MSFSLAAAMVWPLVLAELVGFARLPADTLLPGPPSGRAIETLSEPFAGQPAQGFSSLVHADNGSFLALSDNGYGQQDNSGDFLLRIVALEADFKTAGGGNGQLIVGGYIGLSDPAQLYPWPLAGTRLPKLAETVRDITDMVQMDRLFTGADLDPESMVRGPQGDWWIGDEFGPFLLHFNAAGELMAAPFEIPGLRAPQHPAIAGPTGPQAGQLTDSPGQPAEPQTHATQPPAASLPSSRGFEGLAISVDGNHLYALLEGALLDAPGALHIYTFDIRDERFINADAHQPSYRYRLDDEATAIGEFEMFSASGGLVLERDSGAADQAALKRIYRIDFSQIDEQGFLVKTLWADLLELADPHDLDADGQHTFRFPFHTPEGLVVVGNDTVAVINDNNYPFGNGRPESGAPEASELILVRGEALW